MNTHNFPNDRNILERRNALKESLSKCFDCQYNHGNALTCDQFTPSPPLSGSSIFGMQYI